MRRALVQMHLWLGLVIGLIWALQGLTGAMLVFHRELDRLALPQVISGPMASLSEMLATAQRQTGRPIDRIGIADGRNDLLSAEYKLPSGEQRALLIEAATGQPVGARETHPFSPFSGSASRWLYDLHESLLLGEKGETLVGISGFFLLSASILGLWLGWPRRGSWRAALSPHLWRSTRQRLYGWHRLAGLGAGMLLLVTVPCGIYMIFAAEVRPALAQLVPHQLAYAPRPDPSFDVASISPDAALKTATRRFPDASFVRMAMPGPKSPAYMIRLRQGEEVRAWSGVTAAWVDARSGALLFAYDPLRAPLSNRLADAAFSVHSGEIGRLPGRLLVLLSGLSLPALYVTGLVSWARRRRRRRNPVPPAMQPA